MAFDSDPAVLQLLVRESMPFGRYAGRKIADLPEDYLLWFEAKGFPPDGWGAHGVDAGAAKKRARIPPRSPALKIRY